MAKRHSEYFDGFVALVECSCQAAEYLQGTFHNFNTETLPQCMKELHEIEHRADELKHVLMKKLVKEFVTPIEREDIIQLTNEIDDVTDAIEDVLLRIYMYNIQTIRPEAQCFSDLILRCCTELRTALIELPNFHKSTELQKSIIDVNTLEEEGDALYMKAMRTLYTDGTQGVEVMVWSETFDRLEDCCDACEQVAGVMESVVMKNS